MNIPHKKEEIGFDSDGKVTNCFDVVIPLDTMKEVCKDILQIQVNDDDILADRAQVEVPEGISPGSELLIEIPMGPLAERAILDSHREYDSLTFSQLSALCAQRGLRAFSASKQTLIKRLTLNDKTKFRKDSKDSESFRKLIQNSKLDQRPPRKVLRVIPRSRLDMGDLSPEFCTSAKYEMELTTKALAAMCNRYEIPHHGCTKQKMAKLLMGWKTQVDNELSDLCLLLKTGQIYCLSTHQHFDVDPENLAIAKKLLSSDISVMDLDERGTIDAEELKTILNQTFLDRHTVVSKETCNILINMVDSIGNGTIDQFEYSGLQNQLRNWKKDFDSYDQEKSGFVHYDEVNSMCTIAGYYFSPGFYVLLERSHDSSRRKGLSFDAIVKLLAYLTICHDLWSDMLIDDEVDNSFSSSTNGQPAYEYETKARSASNSSKESAKGSTTGGSSRSIFKKISRHLSASTSSNPGKSKGDMNHQSQQARISHSLFTSLCKKLEIPTEKAEKSWEAFDLANSGSVGFTFEELIYSTCVATKL